jgi:hypothetical protein
MIRLVRNALTFLGVFTGGSLMLERPGDEGVAVKQDAAWGMILFGMDWHRVPWNRDLNAGDVLVNSQSDRSVALAGHGARRAAPGRKITSVRWASYRRVVPCK